MQETAQAIQNSSLFTELTAEESASVNGGYYYDDCYRRRRPRRHYGCHHPRRHAVRRWNCDGSYRIVYRYW